MTLITRISVGSKVYMASDNQVNTRDNIKQEGKYSCKSCIVPGRNILIGISGLLNCEKGDILDLICLDIIFNCAKTRNECCESINKTFNKIEHILPQGWYNVLHISLLENNRIQSFTYCISKSTEEVSDILIPEIQLHQIFLKDCIGIWTDHEYYSLLKDSNWYAIFMMRKWTLQVDFNFNYGHILTGVEIDDEDVWYLYAKCYTLLFFEFIERGWDYSSFDALEDGNVVKLLDSFYKRIVSAANHFKNDRDKDIPFKAIGECNHIILLNSDPINTKTLLSKFPCKNFICKIIPSFIKYIK